ncbi:MAG TPA: ABC transporter substrate-binding protein [Spirochaetia bacterium]|nr:ABC transporter substrate-binding protein [Spirochaetia bacterium]
MKGVGRAVGAAVVAGSLIILVACGASTPQMTPEQIAFQKKEQQNSILSKTVYKPGSVEPYAKGTSGGTWVTDINDDPKSFNPLHAQDAETAAVTGVLSDALLDYNAYKRTWKPNVASYEVKVNKEAGTMDVIFTLRDDLYWTSLADPGKKVKVTSDDVVFWYNDIIGDPNLQQSAYSGQFLEMPDGSQKHIVIEKLNDRQFVLHYPRIVAMPELSSNMDFGPRYIFEPVKKAKGDEGVLNLWSVDTDPKTIPSMGPYYIQSYRPGVAVTMVRNPNYWKKDDYGQPVPYIQQQIVRIVPNRETEKLEFLANKLDSYSMRPEDLDQMVNKDPKNYQVYYAGPSLGARFISWNQNPKGLAPKYVKWFSNQKFRQAMSCFFNRDRVIKEVYRGLAEPAYYFFAKPNPYFDPNIKEQYTYDPERGKKLLAEIGIKPNKNGMLEDSDGNLITYDLEVPIEDNLAVDVGSIFADELKKVGITLNVKPIQFQKIVDDLTKTYSWQSVMISVGSNYFPIQGNNVWLSNGNLHLWHPLESKPATAWEAEIDKLYWEGFSTREPSAAKKIWDRYQQIILDELPIMYIVYPDSFAAYRDKWANLRVDTLASPDMNYVYLKP